jgi:hypothetical protein
VGRRDAVQVTLEVVNRCRGYLPALTVTWEPGWETRGNGTSANYDFGNVHHTGSVTSAAKPFVTRNLLRDGRPDLSGPLCNEAGPWCTREAPRLHVIAAQPANHAGASRASGPVPALALYNPRTRGLEVDYPGSSPMTDGQLLVAHVWARANADVLARGNVEHIRGHAETSVTGKWDPGRAPGKTIDMAAFRRAAAALTLGDDMPDEATFKRWVAQAVWDAEDASPDDGPPNAMGNQLRRMAERVGAMVGHRSMTELDTAGGLPGLVAAHPVPDPDADARTGKTGSTAPLWLFVRESARAAIRAATGSGAAAVTDKQAVTIAEVLANHPAFRQALAAEIVAEQDRRARDGDPATGPVS